MEISAKLAQNIVISMKEILYQDINYMDKEAVIIASTNPKRIGNYHGGAKYVLQNRKNLVIEYDNQYPGTQKGMNIPIYFESEIIGIIGITGNKEEVEKYGEILRRMTEILIKEEYLKDLSFKKRERDRLMLTSLLSDSPLTDLEFLDLDLSLNRFAVVGVIKDQNQDSKEGQIYDILYEFFEKNNEDTLYYIFDNEIILLFEAEDIAEIVDTLEQIINYSERKASCKLSFGIGEKCNTVNSIRKSFQQARNALDWCINFSKTNLEKYEDLTLGLLFSSKSENKVIEFRNKILDSIPLKELSEFKELVEVYGKNNRSINKSAEDLFIHKNTLQYRINKLQEYTNYDLRNINDYVLLKLAFISEKMLS